jgi:hypothetical protein
MLDKEALILASLQAIIKAIYYNHVNISFYSHKNLIKATKQLFFPKNTF